MKIRAVPGFIAALIIFLVIPFLLLNPLSDNIDLPSLAVIDCDQGFSLMTNVCFTSWNYGKPIGNMRMTHLIITPKRFGHCILIDQRDISIRNLRLETSISDIPVLLEGLLNIFISMQPDMHMGDSLLRDIGDSPATPCLRAALLNLPPKIEATPFFCHLQCPEGRTITIQANQGTFNLPDQSITLEGSVTISNSEKISLESELAIWQPLTQSVSFPDRYCKRSGDKAIISNQEIFSLAPGTFTKVKFPMNPCLPKPDVLEQLWGEAFTKAVSSSTKNPEEQVLLNMIFQAAP